MINERIDDLMRDGLKLIQNTDIFCFGMDAVLLSTYATAGKKDRVLDMGTGNGIIPVLMQSKNPGSTYSALEIQEGSAQLARRNVELNHLEDRISVVKGDIKEASTIFGEASFNVVTSNPVSSCNSLLAVSKISSPASLCPPGTSYVSLSLCLQNTHLPLLCEIITANFNSSSLTVS